MFQNCTWGRGVSLRIPGTRRWASQTDMRGKKEGGGGNEHVEERRGNPGLKGNITAWILNKMKCYIILLRRQFLETNPPTNPKEHISSWILPNSAFLRPLCHLLVVLFTLGFICGEPTYIEDLFHSWPTLTKVYWDPPTTKYSLWFSNLNRGYNT